MNDYANHPIADDFRGGADKTLLRYAADINIDLGIHLSLDEMYETSPTDWVDSLRAELEEELTQVAVTIIRSIAAVDLERAAELLEGRDWTRDCYVTRSNAIDTVGSITNAVNPFCADPTKLLDATDEKRVEMARRMMEKHLGVADLNDWNDHTAKRKRTVVKAMRETAEALLNDLATNDATVYWDDE